MESKAVGLMASMLPDPEAVRLERDRAIALDYVRLGESRDAVRLIQERTRFQQRTIYRAIKRQLAWARDQHKNEGSAPDMSEPDGHRPTE